MKITKHWTDEEKMRLGFLLEAKFSYSEIADLMGRPKNGVAQKAQRIYGGSGHQKKTKHKHLRKSVMRYFQNHTAKEVQDKFNITQSEFRSICSVSYREPWCKEFRKDKRNKSAWSTEDYKFMLQNVGFIPRIDIGIALGRGKEIVIKEKLSFLGLSGKNVNGITLSQYRKIFKCDPPKYIHTMAGPPNLINRDIGFWKLVPWVWMKAETKTLKEPLKTYFKTRALFQDWIFDGNFNYGDA